MWNSNSMIAWLIVTAGLVTDQLRPPPRGRAPGWHAGLEVARRAGRTDDVAHCAAPRARGSLEAAMPVGAASRRQRDAGASSARSMALTFPVDLVDGRGDGGRRPIAGIDPHVPVATHGPLTGDLSTRLVRESGRPMSTAVSSLAAHPLYAAVAFAHFGVPDGYVGPHDSPAAFARAVDAARAIARP
jgi:hypothetical protein